MQIVNSAGQKVSFNHRTRKTWLQNFQVTLKPHYEPLKGSLFNPRTCKIVFLTYERYKNNINYNNTTICKLNLYVYIIKRK